MFTYLKSSPNFIGEEYKFQNKKKSIRKIILGICVFTNLTSSPNFTGKKKSVL
jgi:hypothetical protein